MLTWQQRLTTSNKLCMEKIGFGCGGVCVLGFVLLSLGVFCVCVCVCAFITAVVVYLFIFVCFSVNQSL